MSHLPSKSLPPLSPAASQLLAALMAAAPSLWSKAQAASHVPSEQRQKLLDLLEWFGQKHNASLKRRPPADYKDSEGLTVRGHVDAMLVSKSGEPLLAVKLDSSHTIQSAYKLLNLRRETGAAALLLATYCDSYEDVRRKVDLGFRTPTYAWLGICHLSKLSKSTFAKPGKPRQP